jgi:hypothetical protein
MFAALRLRWSEHKTLQAERTRLLAELSPEPASAPAAPSMAAAVPWAPPKPAAGEGAAPEHAAAAQGGFIMSRSAPLPVAAVLGSVSQATASEAAPNQAPSVRGVCPGCQRNVLSNEGRWREGEQYFHSDCVKGMCGGCGKVVGKEALRSKIGDMYWHDECIAGHSR